MPSSPEKTSDWRQKNIITDWEFAEIGALLCDNAPRDLALMLVRLQGQMEVCRLLANHGHKQ